MTKNLSLVLVFLFSSFLLFAQGSGGVEMADNMRQNGKIYVVVAVAVTILIGILLYLIRLDRKISKLEKTNEKF